MHWEGVFELLEDLDETIYMYIGHRALHIYI